MEIVHPDQSTTFEAMGSHRDLMAPNSHEMDMDIDMDVDIAPDDLAAAAALQQDVMATDSRPTEYGINADNPNGYEIVAHKIHLRGVDLLSTDDLKSYVSEHLDEHQPPRIEWIDDTSANVIFDSPETANIALARLSDMSVGLDLSDKLVLRPAKRYSGKPEIHLEVRLATTADVKQRGARERSRYYLFNPDQDPGERRRSRRRSHRRPRRFSGDDERSGDPEYNRRRFDDREHQRRRRDNDVEGFGPNLYDDDDSAVASRENRPIRHRDSRSSFSSDGVKRDGSRRPNRRRSDQQELFPDKSGSLSSARLRRRSASPVRNMNSDTEMPDGARSRYRERSYTPPPPYSEKDPDKELFPERRRKRDKSQELRGDIKPQYNRNKELFNAKFQSSVHRRSDAFDAADETADLFANRMAVPFVDGAMDTRTPPRLLSSRVTKVEKPLTLADRMTFPKDDNEVTKMEEPKSETAGFSIRGAANRSDTQGISIRGQATESVNSMDLFPGKATQRKEFFAQKLDGRGGRRNRAEDLFG